MFASLMKEFQKQFAPSTLGDSGKREMIILGLGVVNWDINNPDSIAKAKALFDESLKAGMTAFKDGAKLEGFDPLEKSIILTKPLQGG